MTRRKHLREELDYQADVVDIVSTQGGFGHKMSNKFIIGVADLLLKPYGCNTCVLEVKRAVREAQSQQRLFDLDLSVLQRNWLRRAHRGGMKAGVLSFVVSLNQEWYRLFTMGELEECATHRIDKAGAERMEYRVDATKYRKFNDLTTIYQSIVEFCGPCHSTLTSCLNNVDTPTAITTPNAA